MSFFLKRVAWAIEDTAFWTGIFVGDAVSNVGEKLSDALHKKKESDSESTPDWSQDELKKIRMEYYNVIPISLSHIMGMRFVKLHFWSDTIDGIEFVQIHNNGTFEESIIAVDKGKKLGGSDFYEILDNVKKICTAFSYIIPRFEDADIFLESYDTASGRRFKRKEKPLVYNAAYKNQFVTPDKLKQLSEQEYEKLYTVLCRWDNLALQRVGRDVYDNWSACTKDLWKQIEILEKNTVQKNVPYNDATRQAIIDAGRKGENDVEYELKWLEGAFVSLRNEVSEIKLFDSKTEESQEYDHIVISEHMIYSIETKNFTGHIEIKPNGNWIQNKDGIEKGVKSPLSQVKRHHIVLKNILSDAGLDIPITDIICISNSSVIISGEENCKVPIVKVDILTDFIENIEAAQHGNNYDLDEVKNAIIMHLEDKDN